MTAADLKIALDAARAAAIANPADGMLDIKAERAERAWMSARDAETATERAAEAASRKASSRAWDRHDA